MKRIGKLLLLCLIFPSCLLAQYEDLLEVESESAKPEERLAQIEYLLDHPLDPNLAKLGELEDIPYLSPALAREIIREREKRGRFKNLEDLLKVKGMKRDTWLKISPFFRIKRRVQMPTAGLRFRLGTKRPKPRGILEGNYTGNPLEVYTRGRIKFGNRLEVGFLTEKDSGERRIDDLLSSYIYLQQPPVKLILGNYQAQFAQGLVLWTGYSSYKGEEVTRTAKRKGKGLIPYTSTYQLYSLNGLGLRLSWRAMEVFAFLSERKLDANITEDGYASSIYQSGYHRTQSEEDKRERLKERIYGFRIAGNPISSLKLGSTLYLSQYSPRLFSPDYERKKFALRGEEKRVGGFDLDAYLGDINIFGELVISQGSPAWILGTQLEEEAVEATVAYRHYPPSFVNLYSGGFADSQPTNEKGFYLGLRLKLLSKTELRFYLDQFRHPWRGYYQVMPWEGEKYLILLKRRILRGFDLSLRGTVSKGEVATEISDRFGNKRSVNQEAIKRSLRLQTEWKPSGGTSFRQRWERLWVIRPNNKREKGNLLRLDFALRQQETGRFGGGVLFFKTDSYDSRIWIYERGLPGDIHSLPLFGEGRRLYLWGGVRPFASLFISLKCSHTLFWGEEKTGTGYEERRGNTTREIGLQVDLSL